MDFHPAEIELASVPMICNCTNTVLLQLCNACFFYGNTCVKHFWVFGNAAGSVMVTD